MITREEAIEILNWQFDIVMDLYHKIERAKEKGYPYEELDEQFQIEWRKFHLSKNEFHSILCG